MIECSGALIYAKNTNRVLMLQKSYGKHQYKWGLVGGTNLDGESVWSGLCREIQEEIGFIPDFIKVIPLDIFVSPDSHFNFHTYFCITTSEFIPTLSQEHCAWCWCAVNQMPKPTHRGVSQSLKNKYIQNKIQTIVDIIEYLTDI